jgi:hypothetical protein
VNDLPEPPFPDQQQPMAGRSNEASSAAKRTDARLHHARDGVRRVYVSGTTIAVTGGKPII